MGKENFKNSGLTTLFSLQYVEQLQYNFCIYIWKEID